MIQCKPQNIQFNPIHKIFIQSNPQNIYSIFLGRARPHSLGTSPPNLLIALSRSKVGQSESSISCSSQLQFGTKNG
jgi:hypothetical protein